MKKVFALLLAVTLIFAAGCSNKTDGGSHSARDHRCPGNHRP